MKKLISLLIVALVFIGCEKNQPTPNTTTNEIEKKEVVAQSQNVEPVVEEVKPEVKVKKPKKLKGIYYRMVTNSIEVFSYRGKLKNLDILDDTKLKNPFYIKGNLVRIEKVYDSKIGDKYGKISGKNLLVSMDDLIKK